MPTHTRFKTPFKKLVSQASKSRKADIAAQLAAEGQRYDIEVDDQGNILDGHTRYGILGDDVRATVVDGFRSVTEKEAYVCKRNGDGKLLTAEQEKVRQKCMKERAPKLIGEGRTQAEVAAMFGVNQATVSRWVGKNMQVHKEKSVASQTPNSRGLSPETQDAIRAGVAAGKSAAALAEELGVGVGTVHKYVKKFGIQRPKHRLGPLPKTMSARALHCQKMIDNGRARSVAVVECQLSETVYARAVNVASNGTPSLIAAMDAEILTPNAARKLLGQPEADVGKAIHTAKERKAAKERKVATADGKKQDRPAILLRLLDRTWTDWLGFRKNTLNTTGWVPTKGEKADKIRHELTVVMQTVKEAVDIIQTKQGGQNGDH